MNSIIPKILVIGAGPSGLAFLRSINILQQKNKSQIAQLQCYDIQSDWSGQWNLEWRTGLNQFGQPLPNSMYKGLWTNTPKQLFEYPDYTFMDHFKTNISSYLPRQVFKSYFMERFKQADIKKFIKFQTAVRYVHYLSEKKKFTAVMHDLRNNKQFFKQYDYVVVGSGHYSIPNSPYYKGFESFPGRIMHAHDLRQWNQFKQKRVLVVGGSLSAQDVASQCYKYGSKHITITYHNIPLKCKFPDKMDIRPCLVEVQKNKVKFSDNTQGQYDIIVLCSGYQHNYQFLSDQLRLKTQNRFYPSLYMGVVFPNNQRIFYIGAQSQVYSLTMFDLQAYYTRDLILGKVKLPSQEQMKRDTQQRQKEQMSIRSMSNLFSFKQKYMRDLLKLSDYPSWDLKQSTKILNELISHKRQNLVCYRDNVYKSAITGITSSRYPKRWLDQFDDSYQNYMSHFQKPKL